MADQALPRPLIGWPLLPLPDQEGRLHFPTLDQSVRQSIQVILSTRPGEQLMHTVFGGGLAAFLHESNTLTTRRRIRDAVVAALNRWEGRILLDRVEVRELPDQPARVRVEIAYRLRRTAVARQLGLTMDLEA